MLEMNMTCEVPQGSFLGPTLWNMFYDQFLRLRLPDRVSAVGFANDLTLVTVNQTTEEIERAPNEAQRRVSAWIEYNGLQLAHSKTEAVELSAKWAYQKPDLYSDEVLIPVKREVRYLGVLLDSKLTFTKHVRAVSSSAVASARALGRIMPNVGGPSMTKRKLLASIITSKILYAAPVMAFRAVRFQTNKVALGRAQRIAALRITRCYRTVSTAAATFLAEILPADWLAVERETVRNRKKAEPEAEAAEISEEAKRLHSTRGRTAGHRRRRWRPGPDGCSRPSTGGSGGHRVPPSPFT